MFKEMFNSIRKTVNKFFNSPQASKKPEPLFIEAPPIPRVKRIKRVRPHKFNRFGTEFAKATIW